MQQVHLAYAKMDGLAPSVKSGQVPAQINALAVHSPAALYTVWYVSKIPFGAQTLAVSVKRIIAEHSVSNMMEIALAHVNQLALVQGLLNVILVEPMHIEIISVHVFATRIMVMMTVLRTILDVTFDAQVFVQDQMLINAKPELCIYT